MLCFATDEAELPDLRKAHNRATRAQMAARRALIENAVASLAHNLVGAYRESGPSGSPIAIRVIGHADSDTAAHQPDYNARLSWQRALTIAKLLRADVAKFGGAYPPQLSFQIEGRSTFDPWPNRAAHCVTHAAAEMTADALAVPPIEADRRVDIEILSGAMTAAGPAADLRLRAYAAGTMPWRPVSVTIAELATGCVDGSATPPETSWIELPPANLIDFDDGKMAVRFRATPVYEPSLKGMRIDLELARNNEGTGVPGYWSVHERLPAFYAKVGAKDPSLAAVLDPLDHLAKCIAGPAGNIDDLARPQNVADMTRRALDSLPKDIDGIMAAAHALHRNLRFVDLKPGMTIQMKGSIADPTDKRLQLANLGTFRLLSDPIDPCNPDPSPRTADDGGPLSDRASFQSMISDPFLAWMTHSNSWTQCPGQGTAENAPAAEAAPMVAGVPVNSAVSVIGSFSDLDWMFSKGPARLFLPHHNNSAHIRDNADFVGARDRGTVIVDSPNHPDIDSLTRAAATDLSGGFDPSSFDVLGACQQIDAASATRCGYMLAQETLAPYVSFSVNGKNTDGALGTRVVHLAPASIYDLCFKDNAAGKWPEGARLGRPISWKSQVLPASALVDRLDCRLLGLPMVSGSSVSW
jgi:hypothetical protein